MRQYVGVATYVLAVYCGAPLSLATSRTQHTVVVEGCQNKKYEYLLKKILQLSNYTILQPWIHENLIRNTP